MSLRGGQQPLTLASVASHGPTTILSEPMLWVLLLIFPGTIVAGVILRRARLLRLGVGSRLAIAVAVAVTSIPPVGFLGQLLVIFFAIPACLMLAAPTIGYLRHGNLRSSSTVSGVCCGVLASVALVLVGYSYYGVDSDTSAPRLVETLAMLLGPWVALLGAVLAVQLNLRAEATTPADPR